MAPIFDDVFRAQLRTLLIWRRDVRRFRPDPLAPELLSQLLEMACLAPSVGLSQPWRFVLVEEPARRAAIRENFCTCNAKAQASYQGARAEHYAHLKLEGLEIAPVQIAVFCDRGTEMGAGLGRQTMPEMIEYSVVAAISNLWIVARAEGIALGWVSILDPGRVSAVLDVPSDWRFIAYLCLGYPQGEGDTPELARSGWAQRVPLSDILFRR